MASGDGTPFQGAEVRVSETDARPLVTEQWHRENPEEWLRLWNQNAEGECPVCFRDFEGESLDKDCPMNSDIPTRCTHWLCTECWHDLAWQGGTRCPVCRDDISEFLMTYDNYSEDSDHVSETASMSS